MVFLIQFRCYMTCCSVLPYGNFIICDLLLSVVNIYMSARRVALVTLKSSLIVLYIVICDYRVLNARNQLAEVNKLMGQQLQCELVH